MKDPNPYVCWLDQLMPFPDLNARHFDADSPKDAARAFVLWILKGTNEPANELHRKFLGAGEDIEVHVRNIADNTECLVAISLAAQSR